MAALPLRVLQLIMTGSTVSGNRSGSEAAARTLSRPGDNSNGQGSLIVNCTISGNGAADAGGGIEFEGDGDLTIIYDTIAFNASFFGGGIVQSAGNGTIHIGNTIVAKNIAPDGPDIHDFQPQAFDDLGHNLFFSLLGQNNAGIPAPVGNINANFDIIGLDPKLGPLANNGGSTKTHALLKAQPGDQCRGRHAVQSNRHCRSARSEAAARPASGHRRVREEVMSRAYPEKVNTFGTLQENDPVFETEFAPGNSSV